MFRYAFSIREKIIVSCAVVSAIIAAMIVATVYLLGFLQTKIVVLEEVIKVEGHVQELRRFEKNLFLYHDLSYGKKALFLAEGAQRVLGANREDFDRATSSTATQEFAEHLTQYEQGINRYLEMFSSGKEIPAAGSRKAAEQSIRVIGSHLSEYAETLLRKEKSDIEDAMRVVRNIQFGQLVLFVAVMLGFWALVFRKIVRPLRVLDDYTRKIARGNFDRIENPPEEREIRQVFDSFNHMSEELQERQRQLVRSESFAALGTLVAGVAHEVNTPLSTIRLHSEVLLEELDGLTDQESSSKGFFEKKLTSIIREADRTLKIVHDLLQLSRDKSPDLKPLRLKHAAEKALDLVGLQIPPEIEVVIDIENDIEIQGDEQRMTTAFMNLISNAIAAIEGDGWIIVEAHNVEDGLVDVSVKDSGKGIAEEDLDNIFDPFFTTKEGEKGKGLGLCITLEIVAAHKGRIWAESIPGEGTTVTLRIPSVRGSE